MRRSVKVILLVIGFACLIGVAFFGLAMTGEIYRLFNAYLDQEIAGPTTLGSEWLEIVPPHPIQAERQIQYMTLDVADSFEPDYEKWALRLQDGSIVKPQVQLVDDRGNV